MSKKEKKQQYLFDFPSLKKHCSVATSCNELIVIEDDDVMEKIQEQAAKSETNFSTEEHVACPICGASLVLFAIDLRARHVEQCLVRSLALKKEEPKPKSQLKALQNSISKKALSDLQIERAKYINFSGTVKRRKTRNEEKKSDTPTDLLPSSRKNEIPELKILRFYASPSQEYEVSVDAFCYKPHDHIRQYFLSHFHSDHYGGIAKRWPLERTLNSKIIYCSSITSRLLIMRFNIDPLYIFSMDNEQRYKVYCYSDGEIEGGGTISIEKTPGLYVTPIDANHCPGAVIFLFESLPHKGEPTFYLHCGDFRINAVMLNHSLLKPFQLGGSRKLAKVYLDTTYMNPSYDFPKQEQVCTSIADFIFDITQGKEMIKGSFGKNLQSRITQFLPIKPKSKRKKCLVLIGTYLIGKERMATAILKKLGRCPIYVSNINSRGDKADIIRAFHDEYLDSVLSSDPLGLGDHLVVVHLVPMKIVGTLKELTNYFNFNKYHDFFERCVGLRPTGWTFQGTGTDTLAGIGSGADLNLDMCSASPTISTIDLLKGTKEYTVLDILIQNPYTAKKYAKFDPSTFRIFSLPYSEHLSFRELCFLVVFLNIGLVIPTVNNDNPASVQLMAEIIADWEALRIRLLKDLGNSQSRKNSEKSVQPLVSLADF